MTSDSQAARRGGEGETDRRGQSEVIGTILLVAVAIVMAAGVGQFVLGLDIVTFDRPTVGPQASFGVTEHDGGTLTIEHESGKELDMDEMTVAVGGSEVDEDDVEEEPGDGWTSGEEFEISGLDPGETVRIIWNASETDDSNVIFEHEYGS